MTLQTERINQLADRIEQCKEVEIDAHTSDMGPAFSMYSSKYKCGSPACIQGHWCAMHYGPTLERTNYSYVSLASDLGITSEKALELYTPIRRFALYCTTERIRLHHQGSRGRRSAASG